MSVSKESRTAAHVEQQELLDQGLRWIQ